MTTLSWDASTVACALHEISTCREQLLLELKYLLDEFNCWDRSTRYYDIIAGDWLEHFAHITYAAMAEVLVTNSSDKITIPIPVTATIQDYDELRRKPSSLQLHLKEAVSSLLSGGANSEWKFSAKSAVISCGGKPRVAEGLLRSFSTRKTELLLVAPYFRCGRVQAVSTLLNWFPWAAMDNLQYPIRFSTSLDLSWRMLRSREYGPATDFLGVLKILLPLHLPIALLEGLKSFRDSALALPVARPKALYSANALHSNLTFKILAAEWCESDTRLLYHQHGGGYGIDRIHAVEDYEERVSDRFYTWGWEKSPASKVQPLSPTSLNYSAGDKQYVLVNCVDYPEVVYRIHFQPMPGRISVMREETCSFLKLLPQQRNVIVRPYQVDYSGHFLKALHEAAPEAEFDDHGVNAISQYSRSKLVVHNYLGTGYLETLALNIPTVCFYDPSAYSFREEAIPFVEGLESVGILHRSGSSAARFVAGISADPLGWWQQSHVQVARDRFVENYANFSSDWKNQWEQEFRRAIEEPDYLPS